MSRSDTPLLLRESPVASPRISQFLQAVSGRPDVPLIRTISAASSRLSREASPPIATPHAPHTPHAAHHQAGSKWGLLGAAAAALLVLLWVAAQQQWAATGVSGLQQAPYLATKHSLAGTVRKVSDWQHSPASTYITPQSHCSISADGWVQHAAQPVGTGLPFLFNLSEQAIPSRQESCAHCYANPSWSGAPCEAAEMPQACCGVCAFEKRFCDKVHPGKNVSEAAAARFMANGNPLHAFTPCELFQRIRGRTLWMLGDSQTWHFYYAVECFLREFALSYVRTPPVADAGALANLTTATLKMCYKPFPVPPVCLELVHGTRVCVVRVDTAADVKNTVLPALMRHVPNFKKDLLLLNTGLHYYDDVQCSNSTCAVPGADSKYVRELWRLAQWRAKRLNRLPPWIWMDTPVQHFPNTGAFSGNFHVEGCEPLKAWRKGDVVARAGGTWNVAAAPLVRALADAHLRTWEASVELWDSHMPGECTHWCSPSAYHIWTYLLNGVLRESRLGSAVTLGQ